MYVCNDTSKPAIILLLQNITDMSTAAKQLSQYFCFCCFWCVIRPTSVVVLHVKSLRSRHQLTYVQQLTVMLSQANRVMPLNFDAHVSRCTMPEWPNSAQTCAVSPWLGFRRIWPTDPFGSRTMVICLPWFMLCAQFHKVQSSVRDNSFFTRRILKKWLTSIQRKPPFVRWRFSVLYVHCQRRDTASAIARLGHCVDIGHWMALAANRLQMKPAKTELLWGSKHNISMLGIQAPVLLLGSDTVTASDHVHAWSNVLI